VLPSPTIMVARRVRQLVAQKPPLLLTGVTMGGGPSHWAVRDYAASGASVYATADAARTFDDDLMGVRDMGIAVVGEDEAARLAGDAAVVHLQLRDFDYERIATTFAAYGISAEFDGVAVAVFDHGAAPPDVSDRQFRFDYLDKRIRAENRLSAFAYPADRIPPIMTRLQAVAQSTATTGLPDDVPLMVMDTAPAAVLGATLDPGVMRRDQVLAVNVGNFHTLAFRLGEGGIEGVFEHHTGEIDTAKLDHLIASLADSTLRHADVFDDKGHGALVYDDVPMTFDGIAVTGPRRGMMRESSLPVRFAVPYGDMMLAGCFGLVRAWADVFPEACEPILASLSGVDDTAPWELL
jgi:uncharacterized protein (DUF1786 family)